MKLWIGLAAALLCSCAGVRTHRERPADMPIQETKTFGPSRVIYVH
jgi:hypothetical protein